MLWRVGEGDVYALLAAALGEELPRMERRAGGKPWFPERPEVRFSVSHSGGWAMCALSEGEVGCDLELVRPRSPGLPRYALSEREFGWFSARGGRWEDFYTLWTLKEARGKCSGEGLVRPVREIAVPLLSPGETAVWEGFRFDALAGEGWRGAVCQGEL